MPRPRPAPRSARRLPAPIEGGEQAASPLPLGLALALALGASALFACTRGGDSGPETTEAAEAGEATEAVATETAGGTGRAAGRPLLLAPEADPEAREQLRVGLSALHDFWYPEARRRFREARRLDPELALAYWGEAFSFHYPFGFSGGSPDSVRAAVERFASTPRARAERARTERARRWLAALNSLAGDGSERERRAAFARGMREVAEAYPTDPEAWAFYAAALLGTAQNIRAVPEIREEIARAADRALALEPRHPGALHYKIHALDTPETAARALDAARTYLEVSPESSHAIHMPSHIFFQLGMWEEAVEANRRAWRASERWVEEAGRSPEDRDYHAADFLHYALLQLGRVAEARRWSEETARLAEETGDGGLRWHAAVWAARERIERADWGAAELPESGYASRHELVAKGLDAARSGAPERARSLHERAEAEASDRGDQGSSAIYPAQRWRLAERLLAAVVAGSEGRSEVALTALEEATRIEDEELPPPNETPDPPKPPLELAGEILLAEGRTDEAVTAFRGALDRRPGRVRALVGLARAASAAGDAETSRKAWADLLEQWEAADPGLPELAEARAHLEDSGG